MSSSSSAVAVDDVVTRRDAAIRSLSLRSVVAAVRAHGACCRRRVVAAADEEDEDSSTTTCCDAPLHFSARRVAEAYLRAAQASLRRDAATAAPDCDHICSSLVRLYEGALEASRTVDAAASSSPSPALPLLGACVTLKEHIGVAGAPLTFCSPAFRENVAAVDSLIVRRLRAAGAVLLGATHTSELGLSFETVSPLHGRTPNPYDARRSAGGSSGGEATAQVLALSCGGVGGDNGGGLRIPAAYCGVVCLRPTHGRVSSRGCGLPPPPPQALQAGASRLNLSPYELNRLLATHGPVASCVDDLELLLSVLAPGCSSEEQEEEEEEEAASRGALFADSLFDWLRDARLAAPYRDGDSLAVRLTELRVAVISSALSSRLEASPGVVAACEKAASLLSPHVAHVRHLAPLDFESLCGVRALASSACLRLAARLWGIDAGRSLLEGAFAPPREPTRELTWHLALCGTQPPLLEQDGDDSQLRALLHEWALFRRDFWRGFASEFDVLVSPATATAALLPQECGEFEHINCTVLASLLGAPACVVGGLTSEGALPCGVQIMAAPHRDDVALAVARVVERGREACFLRRRPDEVHGGGEYSS